MVTSSEDRPGAPTPQGRRPIRRDGRTESRIAVAPADRSADFAAARRNTGRVRFLRIALPLLAVGAVAVFFLATRGGERVELPIDFENVTVDAEATVIERPRLSGYQPGGQAYELTADRAIQRTDNQDLLALENVQARYELPGGETAYFTAPTGQYNSTSSFLTLSGGLNMQLDNGLQAQLEQITVDVPNGLISSTRPFELVAGALTVRGNGLEMREDGLLITGGVETVLRTDGGTTELFPAIGAPGR